MSKTNYAYMFDFQADENYQNALNKPLVFSKATKEWYSRIKRALKAINESGLWLNLKPKLENMLKMSYEDKIRIDKLYWLKEERKNENSAEFKELEAFCQKYPFISDGFLIDELYVGLRQINCDYIWELSEVKLSKINVSEFERQEFSQAIKNKQKYCNRISGERWDRTFEYRPIDNENDLQRAWWSVEYSGCGNGKYYLALNEKLALFAEYD